MKRETEKELLKIVKNNYEDVAEHFSETRKKYIWPELKNLANTVKEDSTMLDLGCGNGRLIEAFDKKVNYYGIDQSEKLIKLAKERHPGNSFSVGDALNLNTFDFKKNNIPSKYDYIFAIAILQHIPTEEKRINLIRGLKNTLNPGGRIIFSNWNMWEIPKYRKLIYKTFLLKYLGKNNLDFGDIIFDWKDSSGKTTGHRYYHAFTKRELKSIFTKAGFKIEKLYKDKFNFYIIADL
ncbi:MAG: methyltransferase [Patescibacteria group bacterium]|jgi:2-polyprenyl-3-methyl-5-hydroxy-6-metoxy-1,4-benzoquinol methylase|nr:methyltransferase [Patescibacteria group bacterium]